MKWGINIDKWGGADTRALVALGVQAVRVVPTLRYDQEIYLQDLKDAGLEIWAVLDSDAMTERPSWEESLTALRDAYGHLIDVWQVGNEADHVSPSSWTLSQQTFSYLLWLARHILGPDAYLVAGGLVSGNPTWLEGVNLDWVQGAGVHIYGQSPDHWMFPEWYFGYASDLIRRYRDYLRQIGRTDKVIYITEGGAAFSDFNSHCGGGGDTDCHRHAHGEYYAMLAETLRAMEGEVAGVFFFCDHRGMVPAYGMRHADGRPLPAWEEVGAVLAGRR